MNAELKRVEVQCATARQDDLTIEYASRGQLRSDWPQQFGEIPVQRFFIAALDQDLASVAKNQRTKSIPLRLEDPLSCAGQLFDTFGEHRQDWRIYRKIHILMISATSLFQALC